MSSVRDSGGRPLRRRGALLGFGFRLLAAAALSGASWAGPARAEPESYDLVIRGGRIVDGTGAPWYAADLGIRQGRIVRIGPIAAEAAAERTIDAAGMIVAPGFIDMMGQTATPLVDDPSRALNLLSQGITTINAGEGVSAAPLDAEEGARLGWTTMAEYFQLLEMTGLPINVAQSVGHTQVRRIVLGQVDRRPGPAELAAMQALVREAMEAGAIGLSTALIYPPAVYAPTEEIAALAAVAGEFGGRYYTHMRNEGDRLLEAIDEALEVGRAAGTPVHIFHLKAAGRQNWDKLPQALNRIRAAREQGQQVAADIYPYVHNGLDISAFVHPRHWSQGPERLRGRLDDEALRQEIRREMETTDGWENWFRHVGQDWNRVFVGQTGHRRYREPAGRSLAEIAQEAGEDPWQTFFELVRWGAFVLPESMSDDNVALAIGQPFVSFSTDVGPADGQNLASHPRAFGAFPRLFARYVRTQRVVELERAVAQATAVAANEIMARDRGRIAEGLAADLVVFDFQNLADRATLQRPHETSQGVRQVIVNGRVVYDDGKLTGQRPGRVLRGPGYSPQAAPHARASGVVPPELAACDRVLRAFVEAHRVPGAAVAITHRGRLVLARGYGYADLATREPVEPTSLFRIASISKPITAVAILKLAEMGKLRLDERVLAILDYEEPIARCQSFDPRWREITIEHLLGHRGGWDREVSFDAMFQAVRFARALDRPPPAGPEEVILAMLGEKLDFDPGQRYAYSNFGYCLLGRVIEKLSGRSYEQFVCDEVLAPLGIRRMQLGRSRLADRRPGEVRYYQPGSGSSVFAEDLGQRVAWPYGGWHLEAMDAHGGWIASAVDLARFACALDDPERCPLLAPASLAAMHARPPGLAGHHDDGRPKDVYYSLGWLNRAAAGGAVNHWHTGSLDGTATILIRRHDGSNLVALFNTRQSPRAPHLGRAIDAVLHLAAAQIATWPEEDQFPQFAAADD